MLEVCEPVRLAFRLELPLDHLFHGDGLGRRKRLAQFVLVALHQQRVERIVRGVDDASFDRFKTERAGIPQRLEFAHVHNPGARSIDRRQRSGADFAFTLDCDSCQLLAD